MHEPFKPRLPVHGKLVAEFTQSNSSITPTQLRWRPVEIPDKPTDFIDGLYTKCGANIAQGGDLGPQRITNTMAFMFESALIPPSYLPMGSRLSLHGP